MRSDPLTRHVEELFACRACPRVFGRPITGAVPGAKVLLLGQAPGPHEEKFGKPFSYTAGRKLFDWFATIGVSEEEFRSRVWISAVIRCFPGKEKSGADRVPSPEEIASCGAHLDREIALLRPELVIGVGTLAAGQLVGETRLAAIVGKKHRASRAGHTFDVVILPHPSGRSTWLHKPEHKELLRRSLQAIARNRSFRSSVARED